jgi:hypothetical protein
MLQSIRPTSATATPVFETGPRIFKAPNGLIKCLRQSRLPLTAYGQRAAWDDPDLAAILDAWRLLPEPVRAGIVAMVQAASARDAVKD